MDQYLGTQRPTPSASPDPLVDGFAGRPLNILVMGIDARDGDNANFAGQFPGQRSDSTFLVHLSADRSRVDIVSVPRDSLVKIPACKLKDGSETAPRPFEMFNAAFDIGSGPDLDLTTAAACTRKTFEQDTGVRTDEHVVIKMDGVRDVIDTLGGVPFCLPEAMDSPKARFKASAGKHVFTGQQAIGFLRSRTGTGNGLEIGSDLGRLDRQHQFLVALTNKVHSTNLLCEADDAAQGARPGDARDQREPRARQPARPGGTGERPARRSTATTCTRSRSRRCRTRAPAGWSGRTRPPTSGSGSTRTAR